MNQVLMPIKPSFKTNNSSEYHLKELRYHDCPISKLYFSLRADFFNEPFCVDLNHQKFLLMSKLWQCGIQVSLLLPDILLRNQNFPGFFRYDYSDKGNFSRIHSIWCKAYDQMIISFWI